MCGQPSLCRLALELMVGLFPNLFGRHPNPHPIHLKCREPNHVSYVTRNPELFMAQSVSRYSYQSGLYVDRTSRQSVWQRHGVYRQLYLALYGLSPPLSGLQQHLVQCLGVGSASFGLSVPAMWCACHNRGSTLCVCQSNLGGGSCGFAMQRHSRFVPRR